MRAGATGSFSTMQKAFRELASIGSVNQNAITSINSLGSALKSFKGPSGASVENTRKFTDMLKGLAGFKAPSSAGLASFLTPLAAYRGPTVASAKNTETLLRALNKASVVRVPGSFNSFLAALSGFKGPNANAGRNTAAFINALANFTPPKGIGSATASFIKLADAIEKALNASRRLNAAGSGGGTGRGKGGGTGGLPRAGDVSRFAGEYDLLRNSVLRTQTAFNALGGVLGVKFIADASNNVIRIQSQLEAATGSVQQARVQFAFVREEAEKLGLEFVTVARSYGQLLGSVKGTNVTFKETQDLFRGFATGARALQLSTEDVDGVFRALGQILSKGKLQAEELRGQLGDRLPGAFVRFAVALKMTKPGELDDALKKGAISGDLLKNALLEVARTMENEFTVAAGKASQTVDSAFARLKNSFTFSAAEFGQSGFNAALIALADAVTKLLDSKGLNNFLYGLASVLEFIGNNIETVAALLGGVLVANLVTTATTVVNLTKVTALLGLTFRGLALAAFAARLGQVSTAFFALTTVMKANVFVLVASAVAGLLVYLANMNSKLSESRDEMMKLGKNSADLTNFFEVYTSRIDSSSEALQKNTDKVRGLIQANLALAQSEYAKVNEETKIAGVQTNNFASRALDRLGVGSTYKPKGLTKEEADLLGGVGKVTKQGFSPTLIRNAQDYEKVLRGIGELEKAMLLDTTSQLTPAFKKQAAITRGYLATIDSQAINGKNLGFNPEEIKKAFAKKNLGVADGDYNKALTPPGISGDVPEKPDAAAKKAMSDAARVAKQDADDVRRAVEGFRELERAAEGAAGVVRAALDGSSDLVATAARATAVDKVADFEKSFGDPARAREGIQSVAAAMGMVGGSYDTARESLVAYYASQKEGYDRSQIEKQVAETIIGLRAENDARVDGIEAILRGGDALAKANRNAKIEQQLLGVSEENREALKKSLTEQYLAQERLNRSEEVAIRIRGYMDRGADNQTVAGLYQQGLAPDDLERAKRLVEYQRQLQNDPANFDAGTINYLVNLEKQANAQEAALDRVADQYAALRNLASESADIIVGAIKQGFEDGGRAGDSFGKRIKDMFKGLKDATLDYLLFNPLQEFLTDTISSKKSGRAFTGDNSGVGNPFNSAQGQDPLNVLGQLMSGNGSLTAGAATGSPSAIAAKSSAAADVFGKSVGESIGDITISANKGDLVNAQDVGVKTNRDSFSAIRNLFDYKTNGASIKDALSSVKDLGSTFGKINASPQNFDANGKAISKLTAKFGAVGSTLSKVASTVGTGLAAYSAGSGVAKALGFGKTGQSIAGGASAGFALGGPVGAAIGAVAGGIKAILFKKSPSSFANVTVGADGRAIVGSSGKRQGGDIAAAKASAGSGAGVFNQVADQLGAVLGAGNYGTFGTAGFKGQGKDNDSFYSVSGQIGKKGKPVGTYGVDYLNGTPDEVQAFALRKQLENAKGNIQGLDPIYQTIARNSTAKTTEDLSADLNIGQSYLAFVDSAKIQSSLTKTVNDLNKSYTTLTRQARALGLNEGALTKARDKLLGTYKKEFDFDVNQQLLGFKDPLLQAYNELIKEYEETVGNAITTGGDLAKVEELFGLKRKKILETTGAEINNSLQKSAQDILTGLRAGSESPLSAQSVLRNSQSQFKGLQSEIGAGNFANADNLATYSKNYLDAARNSLKSSADYFAIFDEVTKFLEGVSTLKMDPSAPLAPGSIPELPAISSIVDKISKQNDDLVEAQKAVGAAVVDGSSSNDQLLAGIRNDLQGLVGILGNGTGSFLNYDYLNSYRP